MAGELIGNGVPARGIDGMRGVECGGAGSVKMVFEPLGVYFWN